MTAAWLAGALCVTWLCGQYPAVHLARAMLHGRRRKIRP